MSYDKAPIVHDPQALRLGQSLPYHLPKYSVKERNWGCFSPIEDNPTYSGPKFGGGAWIPHQDHRPIGPGSKEVKLPHHKKERSVATIGLGGWAHTIDLLPLSPSVPSAWRGRRSARAAPRNIMLIKMVKICGGDWFLD